MKRMKVLILTLAGFVALLALSACASETPLLTKKGSAALGEQVVGATEAVLSKRQKRLACVGDSITFGFGIEGREVNSYPARLQELLGAGWLVGNFGKNGATALKEGHAPYWTAPQYQKALQFEPDLVIIKLGTNDCRPENWSDHGDEYVADYIDLIRSFQGLESKPSVWLCTSAPIFPGPVVERLGFSNAIIKREIIPMLQTIAAETGAEVIDLYSVLDDKPAYFLDGVHPNATGAEVMAKTVAAKMVRSE